MTLLQRHLAAALLALLLSTPATLRADVDFSASSPSLNATEMRFESGRVER